MRPRRAVNLALAAAVSLAVMAVQAVGAGPVPPLGPVLAPGGGIWAAAAGGRPVTSRTVRLRGARDAVTVTFDDAGVPAVRATGDHDLFLAQGYLHAAFRLTQLDLERRLARGRLAELTGPSGVESDTFELRTGLLRTAEATWATTDPASPAGQALTAYSEGVNARLAELRRDGGWPAVFTLAGVLPGDWTPVDSLAVQGLLTQNMSWTTGPLDYALLRDSLGAARTMAWFPVLPPDRQNPYDPGPYRYLGVTPLPAAGNANAAAPAAADAPGAADADADAPPGRAGGGETTGGATAGGEATAAAALLGTVRNLPAGRIHTFPYSNAWAARGPAVAGGGAMLAGDPHLQLTLPSFWYQLALASPRTDVTGASLVGLPGVLVGHNARIAWSMTDMQNQSTLFYSERTSPDRPGQYFWQGRWRRMEQARYRIPVRGGRPVDLTVDLTVHGPVMTEAGRTTAVFWTGNHPSDSLAALLAVNRAQDFTQFRAALAGWRAPTLNFAYADDRGDIAVQAAGAFPVVAAGEPWYPLPGTGEYDVAGTIPYDALPAVHNPPGDVVATANQRPVGPGYPYYIGTTMNAYDTGYRAGRIYDHLRGRRGTTPADFAALQTDVTEPLAARIRPALDAALRTASLDDVQRRAVDELTAWDGRMTEASTGATVWWTFWESYLSEVFQPWWDALAVPVATDPDGLEVSVRRASLTEDLEAWTLHDPGNAAFTPPGRARRDAPAAMRAAFARAVTALTGRLGADPETWRWGKVQTRTVAALSGASALGHGPAPAPGCRWTVNTTGGGGDSTFGPSWRMVVAWTGPSAPVARSVYPGGQSENPASPWYRNLLPLWWNGELRPLRRAGDRTAPVTAVWTLEPAR